MDRAHHASRMVAHKDRQAVGYEHAADIAWAPAESAIPGHWGYAGIIIDVYRGRAMHLFQPHWFARQDMAQEAAVFFDV
jgi:hypothetical protein